MYRPDLSDHINAEAGPSHQPLQPSKPKKRRLQFTSQLRTQIQRYNPDGTETVEYLHHQSTQRLKRKWDSIFERFKDAHLQEQDEIYLGNRENGEPIVVVKDRGSLRSLRQSMEFGVFIKDEELQGWKERPEAREMEDENEEEEDIDPSHGMMMQRARCEMLGGASSSEDDEEEEDLAANDPDLREFLQAEARRKALLGHGEEEEDEEDQVIDFGDPEWASSAPVAYNHRPPTKPSTTPIRQTHAQPIFITQPKPQPDLATSSSEDESDADVVTIHSDSDEELIDSIRTKRQNIEELLQCTTPFETLPYNDIFGLADLLNIKDNTMRLYVDLVSDDEGGEEVASEQGVVASPYPSSLVVGPGSSQHSDPATSQVSAMMPPPLPLQQSPPIQAPMSSPASARTAVVKLEPITPEKVRLCTPSDPSTAFMEQTEALQPEELPTSEEVMASASPIPAEEAAQQEHALAGEPEVRPHLVHSPTAAAQAHVQIEAAQPEQIQVELSAATMPPAPLEVEDSVVEVAATPPEPIALPSTSLPTSVTTPVRKAKETPPSSKSTSNIRSHTHTPSSSTTMKHKHTRWSNMTNLDSEDERDDRADDGVAAPKCGGPGKCTKTFCFDCASL